jgi:hypothetical protein
MALNTMKTKLIHIVLIIVAANLLLVSPALAYLDAGTMTMVFNALAAALFAVAYYVKLNWLRVKAFFKGKRGEADSPPDGEPVEK